MCNSSQVADFSWLTVLHAALCLAVLLLQALRAVVCVEVMCLTGLLGSLTAGWWAGEAQRSRAGAIAAAAAAEHELQGPQQRLYRAKLACVAAGTCRAAAGEGMPC
jgi:hypothetical protein